MFLGLPVAAFDVTYNRETTDCKALYFASSDELADIIKSGDKDELGRIAATLKQTAERRYTWESISRQYSELFRQVKKAELEVP
jgi:glycosyltransferase involved in cell wall biosynthesis